MAKSTPHEFSYGQLVCFTPQGETQAVLGRVLHRVYTISSGTSEDWQKNWKDNNYPWLVSIGPDTTVTVLDCNLIPLKENTDLAIDPLRFGDTAESARAWFADYAQRLAVSDEWGHRVGATADPHYWGIIDRRDLIYWPAGSNPYMSEENYRLRMSYDTSFSDTPLMADEFLETMYEYEDTSYETYQSEKPQDFIDALKIVLTEPNYNIDDIQFLVDDESHYTGQVEHSDHSKLSDRELDTLARAIYRMFEDAGREDDIELLVEYPILGLLPNALFLTKQEAETWLEDNRHNLTKNAHPYLMCDYRVPDFTRLSRNLRQVDWEHSTLTMRNPRPTYPQ